MTIDATAAVSSSGIYSAPATTRSPKQTMDSEVFLNLLVMQLRNQDPSSPMDTNQMISQTTELASMEQLTAMATASDENFSLQMRMAASALVGQTVSYEDADGNTVSGVATSVSFATAVPTVTVGDETLPLDYISGVTATPSTATGK